MNVLSNTQIMFEKLTGIVEYVEKKLAQATPPVVLNKQTSLPLFVSPMTGAKYQKLAVAYDENGDVKGVCAAYSDVSPVDNKRICFSPLFLFDGADSAAALIADIEEFAKETGSAITRIESHIASPVPGMTPQTMTYVKVN